MDRETEARFVDFCMHQKGSFDADEWLDLTHLAPDQVATAALFLAGVEWYGHRAELLQVAERLHKGCVGHFAALVKTTAFDCGRFSGMLRAKLEHESRLS